MNSTFPQLPWALSLSLGPDTARLEQLFNLRDLSPDDVLRAVTQVRVGRGLGEALPPHLCSLQGIRVAGLDEQGQLQRRQAHGEAAVLKLLGALPEVQLLMAEERERDCLHARLLVQAAPLGALLPRLRVLASRKGLSDPTAIADVLRLALPDDVAAPELRLLAVALQAACVDGVLPPTDLPGYQQLLCAAAGDDR